MDEFADGVVGAKSKNIAGLRGRLPEAIALPASATVPFGSFEEALGLSENKDVKRRLEEAIKNIPDKASEAALKRCRDIAMEVRDCIPSFCLLVRA